MVREPERSTSHELRHRRAPSRAWNPRHGWTTRTRGTQVWEESLSAPRESWAHNTREEGARSGSIGRALVEPCATCAIGSVWFEQRARLDTMRMKSAVIKGTESEGTCQRRSGVRMMTKQVESKPVRGDRRRLGVAICGQRCMGLSSNRKYGWWFQRAQTCGGG